MRDQHDIPVLLTGCLAAGGAGMFLIMSVLIGFGVSTLIGREAMYLCLLLELINLLVLHARAGALLRSGKAPQPSPKMRLLRRVSGIGWLTGAVLLVGSLVLLLFGLPLANIWVKLAAYIGVPVMMLSWAVQPLPLQVFSPLLHRILCLCLKPLPSSLRLYVHKPGSSHPFHQAYVQALP